MKVDLHIHSNVILDGAFPSEELMYYCHNAGFPIVVLADHNSLAGVEAVNQKAKEIFKIGVIYSG